MSAYDDMTIADIVHNFAVTRGDLSEQYARDQLVTAMRRKIVLSRGAIRSIEYRAFQRGMNAAAEADASEIHKAIAAAWDEGYEAAGGNRDLSPNPYREQS